jgi:hypothetical protein
MLFEIFTRAENSFIAWVAANTSKWITNEPQGWKAAMVFGLARKLPHCKQVAPMMSESMDHDLSWKERMTVKLHLLVCLACVRYNQQLFFIRDAAQKMAAQIDMGQSQSIPALSDDARDRLKRALEGKQK